MVPDEKVAPGKCDLVQINAPDAVQLSVAVGSVQVAVPVQAPPVFTIIFEGHPLIIGF